jgi:hypothetical protein
MTTGSESKIEDNEDIASNILGESKLEETTRRLLQFINDQENGGNSNDGVRMSDSRSGLVDITNVTGQASHEQTSEKVIHRDEKKVKNQSGNGSQASPAILNQSQTETPAPCSRLKRYIWDDWQEEKGGGGCFEPKDDTESMAAGDSRAEKVAIARQQILDLKAASEEIRTRSLKLKSEQEKLKAEVEQLHAIRIENEANHIKAMKQLKREFRERRAKIEANNEKVSRILKLSQYSYSQTHNSHIFTNA